MDVSGVWRLVSIRGMNPETFEMEWITAEDLSARPEGDLLKMMQNALFMFEDGGVAKVLSEVKIPEGTPQEEIDAFVASSRAELIDGDLFMVQKWAWKAEGDDLFVSDNSHAEVFGETLDPFRKAEVAGNTLVILDNYQIVKIDEMPTEVKKTVKEVKEITPEMQAAAGEYKRLYIKMVCSETKEDQEEAKLILNADGTGTSYRDDLEIKIKEWSINGTEFKMTEKFLGTIDYVGTLENGHLDIFNGDPSNGMTYEYVFDKQ